jgi:hypothetical protein
MMIYEVYVEEVEEVGLSVSRLAIVTSEGESSECSFHNLTASTFISEHFSRNKQPICIGFEVFPVVTTNSSLFWEITPCCPVKVSRCLREYISPISFMMVSCLGYTSTLKMEVIYFSKTLLDFQWTT